MLFDREYRPAQGQGYHRRSSFDEARASRNDFDSGSIIPGAMLGAALIVFATYAAFAS